GPPRQHIPGPDLRDERYDRSRKEAERGARQHSGGAALGSHRAVGVQRHARCRATTGGIVMRPLTFFVAGVIAAAPLTIRAQVAPTPHPDHAALLRSSDSTL